MIANSVSYFRSGCEADLDFRTVLRLGEDSEFRDVTAFHAQEAAEKYIKAVLTMRQVDFPKTHDIRRLLELLQLVEPAWSNRHGQRLPASTFDVPPTVLKPCPATNRGPGDSPGTSAAG